MEIDIHNYESILIDYFDGHLNALEVAEVLLFLEQHPTIKNEFEEFGTLPEPETLSVENDFKFQLKKLTNNDSLAQKSFNELIISQMEGDCNASENLMINEIIDGNKSLIKLKNTFQLTKLKQDLTIVFPHKQALKRKEAVIFYLNRKFAAAAAILLLASLVFLVYKNVNKNIDTFEVAQTNNVVIPNTSVLPSDPIVAEVKNIETPKPKSIAYQKVNLKVNDSIASANNHSKMNALAEVTLQKMNNDLISIPVKPLSVIENSLASNINGAVVPIEIVGSNASEKAADFLTVRDWMKKKLIERGKDHLVENEKPLDTENLALEPINIASLGADFVEKTTGKKVLMSRSFNKEGAVKSYTFAAGNFKFERIK